MKNSLLLLLLLSLSTTQSSAQNKPVTPPSVIIQVQALIRPDHMATVWVGGKNQSKKVKPHKVVTFHRNTGDESININASLSSSSRQLINCSTSYTFQVGGAYGFILNQKEDGTCSIDYYPS